MSPPSSESKDEKTNRQSESVWQAEGVRLSPKKANKAGVSQPPDEDGNRSSFRKAVFCRTPGRTMDKATKQKQ
jgi:hypothetical protein